MKLRVAALGQSRQEIKTLQRSNQNYLRPDCSPGMTTSYSSISMKNLPVTHISRPNWKSLRSILPQKKTKNIRKKQKLIKIVVLNLSRVQTNLSALKLHQPHKQSEKLQKKLRLKYPQSR